MSNLAVRRGRPKKNAPEPAFRQIEQDLRGRIAQGALSPGMLLPSWRELAAEYRVTAPTIKRALSRLVEEGILRSEPRRGTFVAENLPFGTISGERKPGENGVVTTNSLLSDTVIVLAPRSVRSFQQAQDKPSGWDDGICVAVARTAEESGLHFLLLSIPRLGAGISLRQRLERLIRDRPRGIIFTQFYEDADFERTVSELAQEAGVPLTVYGGEPERMSYGDRVASDHAQGAYELTRWLITERKRRRILFIGNNDPRRLWWSQQREAGYHRALEEAGLEPLPTLYLPENEVGDHTEEITPEEFALKVRRTAGYLIESVVGANLGVHAPCDAIQVLSDGDCFTMAAALRLFGREPNQEVDIVGYDNYWRLAPERAWERAVPLATVEKNNHLLGAELVRLLQERAEGRLPDGKGYTRLIEPTLFITGKEALETTPI